MGFLLGRGTTSCGSTHSVLSPCCTALPGLGTEKIGPITSAAGALPNPASPPHTWDLSLPLGPISRAFVPVQPPLPIVLF